MSTPKRHHFVPKHILRAFCTASDAEQIAVQDLDTGRSTIQSIERTAAINHYYSVSNHESGDPAVVERVFSDFEGEGAKIIAMLNSGARITQSQRELFAQYIALQILRTPAAEVAMNQEAERLVRLITAKLIASGHPKSDKLRHGLGLLEGGKVQVKTTNEGRVQSMAAGIAAIVPVLLRMGWVAIRPRAEGQFVLSDSPVCTLIPNHKTPLTTQLINPNAITSFPVRPDLCIGLSMAFDSGRITEHYFDRHQVRSFNLARTALAHRYIYGGDPMHLQFLAKRCAFRVKKASETNANESNGPSWVSPAGL